MAYITRPPSARMLNGTLSTFRQVNTTDAGGSTTITRTPVLVNVAASIQEQTVPHAVVAGSMQTIKAWNIYILSGQDVKPGDTIDNPDGGTGTASIMSVNDLSGRNDVTILTALMQEAVHV
jgi:hypothetical protein